jgi:hypothetical protein
MGAEDEGFTFSAVIISFLTVAGGVVLALIGYSMVQMSGELPLYGTFALGALIGGFVAARASRGISILAPSLGALLAVGAFVAMIAVTPLGQMVWAVAQDAATKMGLYAGGSVLCGALLGTVISGITLGDSTHYSFPWIFYVAFAVLGACFLAYGTVVAVLMHGQAGSEENAHTARLAVPLGIGIGCLVAGLASGAAARTRIVIASFLGAAGGIAGFAWSMTRMTTGELSSQEWQGLAILAIGGGLVTMIGAIIGWVTAGRPKRTLQGPA